MKRRINLSLPVALLVLAFGLPASALATNAARTRLLSISLSSGLITDTDRDRDGLAGPVRRVRTETVKLTTKGGKTVEGQRAVMEVVAYDIKGNKIENAYYPVAGAALTGKEVYKYDDKGNIAEMTLLNADGSLLSKETYTYEFDNFGNWTKMTTSVALIEGGKLSYEPTEVTYRMITYYLDEATLARLTQPAAQPATSGAGAAASAQQNSSNASKPTVNATQPSSVAADKPVAPLPSGGSVVKTSMATPDSALRQLGNVATNSALKVEGEPPPVAPRVPKPLLKPISGGVLNGKAVDLPKPGYPPAARSARASGIVTVEVVIDEKGKVIAAKATSGHTLLRQVAEQAAKEARFSPTLLSGQPVKVSGEINYNFAVGH
ncbi:MAG TPA: energy transducer TonB [Pyrinomonadaceae bacterium]